MEIQVRRVRQMSSGGSFVAIYEAEVEFSEVDLSVKVEILRVHPTDANERSVAETREAIRLGAERVLRPRGLGALIRVHRVVVHPADFSPVQYQMLTSEKLLEVLPQHSG